MENYDFKKNWNDIVPLLELPQVKSAITRGINSYLNNDDTRTDKYDKKHFPLYYARGDTICYILGDNFDMDFTEELQIKGILKLDINEPNENDFTSCKYYDIAMEEYFENGNYDKYHEYCQKIIEPYYNYKMKHNYQSYCLYSGCHWWNNTFGLTIAKLIMPNENWKIVKNDLHTTVVNKEDTKVFDILLYDDKLADFGGDKAYRFATFNGSVEEWEQLI